MSPLTLFNISTAFAQTSGSTIDPSKLPGSNLSIGSILPTTVGIFLTVIALVAFASLIYSGFLYITAGGDAAKTEKARKNIGYAITGIILTLLAYAIIRFVTATVGGSRTPSGSTTNSSTNPFSGANGSATGSGSGSGSGGGGSGGNDTSNPVGISLEDTGGTVQGGVVTISDPSKTFNVPYGVVLNQKPAANVTVSLAKTGDLLLQLSDTSLTFTPDDFATTQGFNVRYGGSAKSGQSATITLTGSDGSVQTLRFIVQ